MSTEKEKTQIPEQHPKRLTWREICELGAALLSYRAATTLDGRKRAKVLEDVRPLIRAVACEIEKEAESRGIQITDSSPVPGWVFAMFAQQLYQQATTLFPLPPTPSPFGKNKIAPFVSAPPAWGAAKAIFAAKSGWEPDEEGRPKYVLDIAGDKLKGRFIYYIILPWDATEEDITIAHKELAWKILKDMGADTAWLHMLLLSYAVDPTRREDRSKKFVIPREEIYHCLGLDKRSDLTKTEKDLRALAEIKKLQHLGLQIVHLQWAGKKTIRRKGEKQEVDIYNWDRRIGSLWEISLHQFGQAYKAQDKNGNIVTLWSDWQLVGSEGMWGNIFLHGDKSLRQFGYVAREMLEKVDRYRCPWGAALAVMLTFQARFNPFGQVEATNREIISFAGGEEYPVDRRKRYEIRLQVLNAIEEQRKWGLEPDYSPWPKYLQPGEDANILEEDPGRLPPGYWDDFLRCKTIFRPMKDSQAEAVVQANQQVKYLPEPAAVRALPKQKKAWTGSDIKELRGKLGLTQKQLAAFLEVSPMLISHFETGRRRPNPRQRQKLTQLDKELEKSQEKKATRRK
jgi:DNA-binding transcriptional regulator YiaG